MLSTTREFIARVQVSDFKRILKAAGSSLQLSISDAPRQRLPPASLQTFVKERANISGLVITNHQKEFVNRYGLDFGIVCSRMQTADCFKKSKSVACRMMLCAYCIFSDRSNP